MRIIILTAALIAATMPVPAASAPSSTGNSVPIPRQIYHVVSASSVATACGSSRLETTVPYEQGLVIVRCRITDAQMAALRAIRRASAGRARRAARTARIPFGCRVVRPLRAQ